MAESNSTPVKNCVKCKITKPLSDFSINRSRDDGLQERCKACNKVFQKAWYEKNRAARKITADAWYAANKERKAATGRAWMDANKQRFAEYGAAWYEANKEHVRKLGDARYAKNTEAVLARMKAFRKANPERHSANASRNRAKRAGVVGSHTAEDIKNLMAWQRGKCAVCKKRLKAGFHKDHVMPLARGGTNNADNLQLLCQRCNNQKCAKHPIDYMQQRGYLL